ncbi:MULTISPECIES: DUF503 domain-containing protein [Fictibacillus]|uniref:DUF503 domain-containing protein n=1 Tax=Fictibacillus terranigra TaxID=3058424 RepID=A0ABT8E658_9BACL|nr:DUF503 domain-containing protein [Fictibacillus sp. CENA-BCM004]MDN4073397.1 DUF503 domain-containing protein [Fictibacillus sp. CENA-BCM004]
MIGFLTVECFIYESHSLKEKRSVVKKAVTRLRQQFNLAVSETDFHDLWQRAELGIVTISKDKLIVEQELQKAIKLISSIPELEVTTTTIEWL